MANYLNPDDRVQSAASVPLVRTNPEKPDPKSGAVQLEWNLDGTLLMARFGTSSLYLVDIMMSLWTIRKRADSITCIYIPCSVGTVRPAASLRHSAQSSCPARPLEPCPKWVSLTLLRNSCRLYLELCMGECRAQFQ